MTDLPITSDVDANIEKGNANIKDNNLRIICENCLKNKIITTDEYSSAWDSKLVWNEK